MCALTVLYIFISTWQNWVLMLKILCWNRLEPYLSLARLFLYFSVQSLQDTAHEFNYSLTGFIQLIDRVAFSLRSTYLLSKSVEVQRKSKIDHWIESEDWPGQR